MLGQLVEHFGEFSEAEADLYRQLCAPGDTVLDIGANIGVTALPLAQMVGAGGHVIAFEPQRLIFQTLCANVAINSLTQVQCFNAAVGAADGTVLLGDLTPDVDQNFGGIELALMKGAIKTPVIALDTFLDVPKLKLIKLDVEGMELDALRGVCRRLSGTGRFFMSRMIGRLFPKRLSNSFVRKIIASIGTRRFSSTRRIFIKTHAPFWRRIRRGARSRIPRFVRPVHQYGLPAIGTAPEPNVFREIMDTREHPQKPEYNPRFLSESIRRHP